MRRCRIASCSNGRCQDDDIPQRVERTVVAYSMFEAMMQAIMEASGKSPDDVHYKVKHVGPDIAAYVKLLADEINLARLAEGNEVRAQRRPRSS